MASLCPSEARAAAGRTDRQVDPRCLVLGQVNPTAPTPAQPKPAAWEARTQWLRWSQRGAGQLWHMGQAHSSGIRKAPVPPPAPCCSLPSQALCEQEGACPISPGEDGLPQTLPGCPALEEEIGTGYFSTELHGASAFQGEEDLD